MDEKSKLLKQDVRGRVRTPVERREMLLEEFGRSGLSGPKFAGLVGVKYQTLQGGCMSGVRRVRARLRCLHRQLHPFAW
jgi:hypothetical protein